MGNNTAVGIHHELAPGQTSVRLKAAQHKGAAGVNKDFGVLIQVLLQCRHKDELIDSFPKLLLAYLRLMLSGNYYGSDPHGLAILILHGHLGLAVWSEPFQQVVMASLGQTHGDPVGQHHRQGQKLGCFLAGVAIYDSLVARGDLVFTVYCLCNIRGLVMDIHFHLIISRVANPSHRLADDVGDIRHGLGGDLTSHRDLPGSGQNLTGHPAVGIAQQAGVQHCVRNGVTELVWMALGDGFGGQNVVISHGGSPFPCVWF